ncbi:hypothetical protein GCM10027093_61010 [Paraburkholderia jirisanensis]
MAGLSREQDVRVSGSYRLVFAPQRHRVYGVLTGAIPGGKVLVNKSNRHTSFAHAT